MYKFSKKDLKNAIAVGGKFSNSGKIVPILECVCVNIDESGKTTIMSTDLENTIYSIINTVEGENTPVRFCVRGVDFEKCVSLINDDFVGIEYVESERIMMIKYENGMTQLPTYSFDEFPKTKIERESASFSVSAKDLMNAISDGQKFVIIEDMRPTFGTVFFKVCENKEIEYCSTDAHSLLVDRIKFESEDQIQDVDFMVPAKAFQSIVNICNSEIKAKGENAMIKIKAFSDSVLFSVETCKLISKKVEGRYPNYSAILKNLSEHNVNASVDVNDFLMSVKRVGLSSPENGLVRLDFSTTGELKVSSESVDFGKKSIDTLKCETNQDLAIGVSMSLALRCLSVINAHVTSIKMKNATSALVFEDALKPGRTILLMPLMLS